MVDDERICGGLNGELGFGGTEGCTRGFGRFWGLWSDVGGRDDDLGVVDGGTTAGPAEVGADFAFELSGRLGPVEDTVGFGKHMRDAGVGGGLGCGLECAVEDGREVLQ